MITTKYLTQDLFKLAEDRIKEIAIENAFGISINLEQEKQKLLLQVATRIKEVGTALHKAVNVENPDPRDIKELCVFTQFIPEIYQLTKDRIMSVEFPCEELEESI